MKCQTWVKAGQPRKDGTPGKVKAVATFAVDSLRARELAAGAVVKRCGGKLIVTVKAVDEPYYGGTNATLEVEVKCEKCGEVIHPDIEPDEYNLSKWFTAQLAKL